MNGHGICCGFGYRLPISQRLSLIKQAGFDHIGLWWGDEYVEVNGDKRLAAEMSGCFGLRVENVHASFEGANHIWADSLRSRQVIDHYKACISDCAELGIPAVVIHLTKGDSPPPPSQLGLDRLQCLVEFAEAKGVSIALENVRKPEYLDLAFSNVNSNRLGFCYDSGHANCYSPALDLLGSYGDKLIALHLHDNDGASDQHMIPGEGTINWKALLARLSATGYQGPVSLEVISEFSPLDAGLEPDAFLRKAYRSLSAL